MFTFLSRRSVFYTVAFTFSLSTFLEQFSLIAAFNQWDQCQYPTLGSNGCQHGGLHSICDPDQLLSSTEALEVQRAIDNLRSNTEVKDCSSGLAVGVALMEGSKIPDLSGSTSKSGSPCVQTFPKLNTSIRVPTEYEKQLMAKEFSTYFRNEWKAQLSPRCDAVLIVFFSKEYRRLYMRTTETAHEQLNNDKIDEIFEAVRVDFRYEQYEDGLLGIMREAEEKFNAKPFPVWGIVLIVLGGIGGLAGAIFICCKCGCCSGGGGGGRSSHYHSSGGWGGGWGSGGGGGGGGGDGGGGGGEC